MAHQSINPSNGKVVKTFLELTAAQLAQTLRTAAHCLENWRRATFFERRVVAARAVPVLCARVGRFARPMTLEMGKLEELCKEFATWDAVERGADFLREGDDRRLVYRRDQS